MKIIMEAINSSRRHIARQAALLYLLLVCVAIYGTGYVPSKIFMRGNVAATANNLLVNETMFRSGILSHLATTTAIAVMVLLLYRLFRQLNKHLCRLMVSPVLVQVAIVVILEVFHFAALMILKGDTLSSFTDLQRQELSYFFMRVHGFGIGISQIFWGLWLFPFGMLVHKSGAMPRVFAVLLVINGAGYVAEGCAFVMLERPGYLAVRQFTRLSFIGLPLTMLWMLVKGVRCPA